MPKNRWVGRMLALIIICCVPSLARGVAPPSMPTTMPAVALSIDPAQFPHTLGYYVVKSRAKIGEKHFTLSVGVFLPPCLFTTKGPLPVVMALHNRGQSGANGLPQEGLGMMMRTNWADPRCSADPPPNAMTIRKDAQFIGLAPQCPLGFTWASPGMAKLLGKFIDQIVQTYQADDDRVYLTGFSYGASSTWVIAAAEPDRFAGIAPMDGRATSNPQRDVARLKDVAVFLVVGDTDGPFDAAADRMHEALVNLPHRNFVWTLVNHGNHFTYYSVCRDPDFWTWLFTQRRHHADQSPTTLPVVHTGG